MKPKSKCSLLLLTVLLIALLLPAAVSAKDLDIVLDGAPITDTEAVDVYGDGTVCYDYKSSKLTLKNATIDGWVDGTIGYGMRIDNALSDGNKTLTIELIGNNIIIGSDSSSSCWGLFATPSRTLRFTGSGSLFVKGGVSTNGESYGIESGNLIMDGGTVVACAGVAKNNQKQVGLKTYFDYIVRGGTIVCDAGDPSGGKCTGMINVGGISISDGCVIACGNDEAIYVEPSFETYYPAPKVSVAADYNAATIKDWNKTSPLASTSVKYVRIMPYDSLTVQHVNITGLTYPRRGEAIDLTARGDTANVVNVTWYSEYSGSFYPMYIHNIFPISKCRVEVDVVPAPGMLFSSTTSATLFGKTAKVVVSSDRKRATISTIQDIDLRFWNMPFVDVAKGEYYYEAVQWAYNNDPQITAGTDEIHFSPGNTCTRAQAVTFLWRAAGCPEPMSSYNPFYDVPKDQFYTKAVLWAVEEGITVGTGATTFNPKGICSRAQIVCFLYRMEGSPSVYYINPFVDVSASDYFYTAVLWAAKNNITAGTDATHFSPDKDCKRGQIVTFLCRYCGPVG